MSAELSWCDGTYVRGTDGRWRYRWGEPVPGAVDLTAGDVAALRIDDGHGTGSARSRPGLEECLDILGVGEATVLAGQPVPAEDDPERVVAMLAPELNALLMLTVGDIAQLADVSKATVDSYRYRGYLPRPQVVKSRTPLWSRPVVRHWLEHRPGSGWRTDVYGSRERRDPPRQMPLSRARAVTDARRRSEV